MSIESLMAAYGYPALFVGTLIEGETFILLSVLLSQSGYLNLPLVFLVAAAGAFAGDQFFFSLGRSRKAGPAVKNPRWQKKVDRVQNLIDRHQVPVFLGYRFLYGLRAVTPFVIGMGRFSRIRFMLYSAAGTLAWTLINVTAGLFLGRAAILLFKDLKHVQIGAAVSLGIGVLLIGLVRRFR